MCNDVNTRIYDLHGSHYKGLENIFLPGAQPFSMIIPALSCSTLSLDSPTSSHACAVQRSTMANSLFQAVANCHFSKVKYYLEKGAKVTAVSDNGDNLLQAALTIEDEERRRRMFHYLTKKGADSLHVNPRTGKWLTYYLTIE